MIKCRTCQTLIEKDLIRCPGCGCPKKFVGIEVEDSSVPIERSPPEMPTIMGSGEFVKSAMCPCCDLIMYIKDTECPHCSHLLTSAERKSQQLYSRGQRLKGYKFGAIFTIGFILLFTFVFGI